MRDNTNRSVSRRPDCVLRARALRESATPSEQALWLALRSSQLGVRFRRQVPIARFIVDFLAPEIRLVVEVDGGYHRVRRAADARRDRVLQRLRYSVLRLEAALVERSLPAALGLVRAQVEILRVAGG